MRVPEGLLRQCSSEFERLRPISMKVTNMYLLEHPILNGHVNERLIIFFTHLSREETNVFPLNMFAKCHLEQCQSHVQSLNNVTFPGQRMIPPGRLSPGHLALKLIVKCSKDSKPFSLLTQLFSSDFLCSKTGRRPPNIHSKA